MLNINNNTTNNIFKDFESITSVNTSYSAAISNSSKPDSIEINTNKEIASVKVADTEPKKSKKKGILVATVGTSILTAGIAALVLTKGFSSASYKKINQLIDILNDKIYSSTISEKSKGFLDKVSLVFAKGMKSVLSGLKGISNFNAVKDNAFDNVVRKSKRASKAADNVTGLFKKFAYESVDSSYSKVHIDTDDMYAMLKTYSSKLKTNADINKVITIKGVQKTLGEWIEELGTHTDEMKTAYEKGFSKKIRLERDMVRQDSLSDLSQKVKNTLWHENGGIINFKQNAQKFKTYITEDLSQDGKVKLRNEIMASRKALSNNIEHNYSVIKTNLGEIADKIDIEDTASAEILRKISGKMTQYKKLAGVNEITERANLTSEIIADLQAFSKNISASEKYSSEIKKSINSQLEYISQDVLQHSKKGSVEEILTIINGLQREGVIDKKTAKVISSKADKITKGINKASSMEANDLYDKMAEFKVGSAPTDLLGLIFPVGVAGAAIASADNKNERVSTALTTGIPILGSIASMMYGTTKMLTGPKNLILSFSIGAVLNGIGTAANKLYLSYQEKQSIIQVALDAYKNNTFFNPKLNEEKSSPQ